MVTLRNLSTQGKELIFFDGKGYVHHWLDPKNYLQVPKSFLTDTVVELARRNLISIREN